MQHKMYSLYISIFLVFIINQVTSLQENYFWREYTGSIPEDAVVAGKDINGNDVYVGQAYVKNEGLIVVQIYSGAKEVYAPIKGIKKIDKYIKILCGPQQNFYWISANSSNLHLLLLDKHAVIGGHEDGQGQCNIGRISHEGEVKIGKINAFSAGSAGFFFNDKGTERMLQSYEVLVYDKSTTNKFDIRIKSI